MRASCSLPIPIRRKCSSRYNLKQTYQVWSELPDQLIALRDDLLENQPALKLLDNQGKKPIIIIQREIEQMLDDQETRSPSATNTALLRDMAEFQSSFALLVSALPKNWV